MRMSRKSPAHEPAISKREQNKLANRAAILIAARHCFLELGYDAVTVRDVVRHTKLASGTFYNYFPDTESLFRAALEEPMQRLTQRLHEVRSHAGTVEDFLFGAYRTVFTEVRNDPEFFTLLFRNEPMIRTLFGESVLGVSMRMLKQDLRSAIRRGVFPLADVDALTGVLFAAGYELARLMIENPKRTADETARFATDLFLRGISPERGSAAPVDTTLIRRGSLKLDGNAR
jgi:AcrR family transcriptional regulator